MRLKQTGGFTPSSRALSSKSPHISHIFTRLPVSSEPRQAQGENVFIGAQLQFVDSAGAVQTLSLCLHSKRRIAATDCLQHKHKISMKLTAGMRIASPACLSVLRSTKGTQCWLRGRGKKRSCLMVLTGRLWKHLCFLYRVVSWVDPVIFYTVFLCLLALHHWEISSQRDFYLLPSTQVLTRYPMRYFVPN